MKVTHALSSCIELSMTMAYFNYIPIEFGLRQPDTKEMIFSQKWIRSPTAQSSLHLLDRLLVQGVARVWPVALHHAPHLSTVV